MATFVVLAHFGHWYISLPVYLGPPVVLVVALKVADWRDRRRRPREKG